MHGTRKTLLCHKSERRTNVKYIALRNIFEKKSGIARIIHMQRPIDYVHVENIHIIGNEMNNYTALVYKDDKLFIFHPDVTKHINDYDTAEELIVKHTPLDTFSILYDTNHEYDNKECRWLLSRVMSAFLCMTDVDKQVEHLLRMINATAIHANSADEARQNVSDVRETYQITAYEVHDEILFAPLTSTDDLIKILTRRLTSNTFVPDKTNELEYIIRLLLTRPLSVRNCNTLLYSSDTDSVEPLNGQSIYEQFQNSRWTDYADDEFDLLMNQLYQTSRDTIIANRKETSLTIPTIMMTDDFMDEARQHTYDIYIRAEATSTEW